MKQIHETVAVALELELYGREQRQLLGKPPQIRASEEQFPSLTTHRVTAAVGFLYTAFIMLRHFPSGPTLFSVVLSQKGGAEFHQMPFPY